MGFKVMDKKELARASSIGGGMGEILSWILAILGALWWSILWTAVYPYYVLKSLVKHESLPSYFTTLLLLIVGRLVYAITLSAINSTLNGEE